MAVTAEKALAKEQGLSLLAKIVLAEYDAQTIASWDAAAVEAVALEVTALTKLKAAPKLRYGGPPPTHFSPPLTAKEVAELDAATLDKQRQAATQEKALADKADKQRRAAALEKVLADDANKQCQAAMQEKALADEAKEQCWATAQDKALANEANKRRHYKSAKCTTTSATKRLPRMSTTRMTMVLRGDLRHMPHPSLLTLTSSWPKSESWMMVLATGLHLVMRSLPRRTMKPQLQRCRPQHPQRPCHQPPTTLLCIRTWSLLPWGGAFVRSL